MEDNFPCSMREIVSISSIFVFRRSAYRVKIIRNLSQFPVPALWPWQSFYSTLDWFRYQHKYPSYGLKSVWLSQAVQNSRRALPKPFNKLCVYYFKVNPPLFDWCPKNSIADQRLLSSPSGMRGCFFWEYNCADFPFRFGGKFCVRSIFEKPF